MGRRPEQVLAFYRLHVETRRQQGVPVQPWRFFDLLGKRLLAEDLGFVLLAYHQEEVVAGMVLLGWGQTLIYKYGASLSDRLHLRPNDLLFYTALQYGVEHGYQVFDFGRTDLSNTGLRRFKSGWGAEEKPLTYSTFSEKMHRPANNRMMTLLNTTIKNSPAWVCRTIGELLYRHVG
jgi:predicted N-acyltransferase